MNLVPALIGGAAGLAAGTSGAVAAATLQLAARRFRNRALVARCEPAVKDEVWRPPWIPFGVVGAIAGTVLGAVGLGVGVSVDAGLVLPALVALTAIPIALQARARS